jgi:hypothetical protein
MSFKSIRKRLFLAAVLGAVASPALAAAPASDPGGRGQAYATVPPMNQTVETRLLPQMAVLLDKLMVEKRDMTLDGVRVFDADDKFLPGKVAIGLAYLLIDTPRDDPKFKTYLAGYRQIADMTVDDTNNTWGIYYYCQALHMLQQAGLLEQAVSPATLAKLKAKLDWREFRPRRRPDPDRPAQQLLRRGFQRGAAALPAGLGGRLGQRGPAGEDPRPLPQVFRRIRFRRRDRRRRAVRPLQRAADRRDQPSPDRGGHAGHARGQGLAAQVGRPDAAAPEPARRGL